MVTHPCTPWERAGRPTYSSQIAERGFAVTTSGETSAAHRSITPFLITIAGFVLAFGFTIWIRQHAPRPSTAAAAAPPAAVRVSELAKASRPVEGASSAADAVLFPPPPAIPGVATATLLGPASDLDSAVKNPAGKHRHYGRKHVVRRAAATPPP
jgi:hypothetical protein